MKEITRLIRCDRGHFYDGGRYEECPHCNNTTIPPVTEYIAQDAEEVKRPTVQEPVRVKSEKVFTDIYSNTERDAVTTGYRTSALSNDNENHTMHYFQKTIGAEPVVGWVVCTKGMHFGEDFKIKSGRNFIGRSGSMNISLSADRAVSRDKHAILTYDPKKNVFMIQPGDSPELCYLNDETLLIPTQLKAYDKIALGESELMFIPFCSESFNWEDHKTND